MVKNVAAPNLGKAHTFSISDGKDTYTIKNASVLSYVRTSIINGNENRKTLGRAIYLYYKAADAYFNQGD
ncbi:MAG: hypothetical protein Q4A32_02090 [Lachnospiraceae bacterium]|nr:hypothetical protein [Lachnospiraceae bacterium]